MTEKRKKKEAVLAIAIMVLAMLTRILYLSEYPGGNNADEAFAGYEAWCLANYGTDSWGISNPVYLTVWGSGMSVLNTILMIPFVKIGGLNTFMIRLPQVIVGVVAVYVFYLLLRKIASRQTALIGMALLAICPWHIMMCRFGMDCNLAPEFMLFATYFLVLGLEKSRYLIVSAFFWGISLYCYATVWIVIPLVLLCWGIYLLYSKKIKWSYDLGIAIGVLFLLALPLLMFVIVNIGIMEPIYSPWISIPRLVEFRSDEVGSIRLMIENVKALIRLMITQNDGLIWNTIPYFGLYYLVSGPFILIGAVTYVKNAWEAVRKKTVSYEFLILSWIAISAMVGILQGVNANKINSIHFPVIILWTVGVSWVITTWKHKLVRGAIIVIYLICFLSFQGYYYTAYQEQISARQLSGADEALEVALRKLEENESEKIYIPNELRHSHVLFYTQWPLDDYLETVEWQSYPQKWLKTASFGSFIWETEAESELKNEEILLNENYIYIITQDQQNYFEQEKWTVEMFDNMGVAYDLRR